jgi:outer membrane protein TolC
MREVPVFIILSHIVVLFFFVPLFAQSESGGKNSVAVSETVTPPGNNATALTEEQVIEFALKNSRKIQSLNTNVDIENYRLKSSGWLDNPELRLSNITNRHYADALTEVRAGIRMRLPQLGEMEEERQQARVDYWDQKVEQIRYRQEFIARVRKEYADVLMYDRLVEIAQQRVIKAAERIRIIEELVKLGSRSIVYYTKAKMWQAESNNDLSRAMQNRGLARRKLAKRSNIDENTHLVLNDLPEMTQEVEELIKLAFNNRPEIELVQQRIELANRQKRFEELKILPWFNYVEYSYHFQKERNDEWKEFRAGINIPVFNWNIGNIKAMRLACKKKAEESDAIKESIEDEVRSAYIIYKDVLLDWKDFNTSAQELITNAQAVVDQAQQHETLMPDEVMEMEWTIFDMQKLLTEKRQNLANALIDLYFAIGIEGPEKLF